MRTIINIPYESGQIVYQTTMKGPEKCIVKGLKSYQMHKDILGHNKIDRFTLSVLNAKRKYVEVSDMLLHKTKAESRKQYKEYLEELEISLRNRGK